MKKGVKPARKLSSKRLRSVSYHEAGHGIVLLDFALPFDQISNIPDQGYDGCCVYSRLEAIAEPKDRKFFAKQLIIVCYAGEESQKLVEPHPSTNDGSRDREDACRLAVQYGLCPRGTASVFDPNLELYLDRKFRKMAFQFVSKRRHHIEVVAKGLLEHSPLTQEEVEKLIAHLPPLGTTE